ncbi:hypothetical protein POVCU2_0036450 [Plasmodium ovale curtisi]|uniref:Uncharacterized protein n=1 Tax=Plasmodium ovale curtisi TaxID=864141 RepID=A0A1A8W584_PLAOA|nr:hypothetical protein POVCU2_0036450 [Plasmodium ovale curtisi]
MHIFGGAHISTNSGKWEYVRRNNPFPSFASIIFPSAPFAKKNRKNIVTVTPNKSTFYPMCAYHCEAPYRGEGLSTQHRKARRVLQLYNTSGKLECEGKIHDGWDELSNDLDQPHNAQ